MKQENAIVQGSSTDKDLPTIGEYEPAGDCVAPPLLLSSKSQVWGTSTDSSLEPKFTPESTAPRHVHARSKGECMFCGFASTHNEIHNINDNHLDIGPANLGTICALCHRWQHLGQLQAGDAYLCFLPGLAPSDINHLQRTLLVALESNDPAASADALALLNWMASHRNYVQKAWGTYEPATFAVAMLRQPGSEKELREIVFGDMGLVFRPACLAGAVANWSRDAYRDRPVKDWANIHHGVMNAPI
ncbi:MAG: HNH endonuclease [Pseudomonadota bacterium]